MERILPTAPSRLELPERPPSRSALYTLAHIQSELIAIARERAIDEVGAAVAHQLNDPMTALLIYLHELEQLSKQGVHTNAAPAPVWEIAGKAAREAERICEIIEKMNRAVGSSGDAESAVAYGLEAIAAMKNGGRRSASDPSRPLPASLSNDLTPREREVLAEIMAGASNKIGSFRLGISKRTFEVHRANIMRKLGARNAADLVRTVLSGNS